MNIIRNIFSQAYTPTIRTQLGRWNIQYEPKIIQCKVDQANEDHCGCCNNHIQIKEKEQVSRYHQHIEDDTYYEPYIYY